MSQEHFDMVIKNVNMLLTNKGMKPADLIRLTGIDQPHMSKVLNGKSRFTLDQIIEVADALNVSVDYLIGHTQSNETTSVPTNAEIYRFFSRLLENKILQTRTLDIEEDAYVLDETSGPYDYPYWHTNKQTKYKIFYFSNYMPLLTKEEYDKLDEEQQDNYTSDLNLCGNDYPRNAEFNEFLTYYYKLYDIKKNSGMAEEIYQTAIQDHLDKLKY